MIVSIDDLRQTVASGVAKLGYEAEEAQIIIDTLLYAEMRGNNQGIAKIATGGVPNKQSLQPYALVKENKCAALFSGGHSMVSSAKAADKAVQLALKHGVGIVGVNHTFTSSGAIGYFSRRIAEQACIGIVCVGNGSFQFVAPEGSAEARFGTNPISYAFPYDDGTVVFDNATAALAYFGIVEAKLNGTQLPPGLGYDAHGQPSTDPQAVLQGSVKAFANHKGYGLSLLVQMLGGSFVLAGSPNVAEDDGAGTFVMAIDVTLFAEKQQYLQRAGDMVRYVTSAKPLPGKSVWLPGEQGDERARQCRETGQIEIADGVWKELIAFVAEDTTSN